MTRSSREHKPADHEFHVPGSATKQTKQIRRSAEIGLLQSPRRLRLTQIVAIGEPKPFAAPADCRFARAKEQKMKPEFTAKHKPSGDRTVASHGIPVVLHVGPDGILSPFVTHWSRILHYDLFTGESGATASGATGKDDGEVRPAAPAAASDDLQRNNVETPVARKNHDPDDWIPRFRTPIEAAVILLGIYIAIYLTVAGFVHVLGSPEATAAATRDTSVATQFAAPTAAADSAQRETAAAYDDERSTDTDSANHDHVD